MQEHPVQLCPSASRPKSRIAKARAAKTGRGPRIAGFLGPALGPLSNVAYRNDPVPSLFPIPRQAWLGKPVPTTSTLRVYGKFREKLCKRGTYAPTKILISNGN